MSHLTNHLYEFGPFSLDAEERQLRRANETVSLTPKAFDLLLALVERHGHLVEKDELLKLVWPGTFVEEANLSYNVSLIRKALGEGEDGRRFIETVPRRGYRFVAEVREAKAGGAGLTETILPEDGAVPATVGARPAGGEGRDQKRRSAIVLATLIVALAGVCFWLYRFLDQRQTPGKGSAPVPRIVPLTSFSGSESQPAFSPDGRQVAFVWNGALEDNPDIYVKFVESGEPLRLTNNPASDLNPVWSPDGRQLAFLRKSVEGDAIYLVSALGGAERKLTEIGARIATNGEPSQLAWQPNGEWLAIADKTTPGDPVSISLFSAETHLKRGLTAPPAHYFGDWNPSFSPDGKTLAFTRAVTAMVMDIYLVSIGGGEPRRLTFDDAHIKSLDWTHDGREIVFSSSRGMSINVATLWRISVDGGLPERLIGIGQNAFSLAVNRHRDSLAYAQRIHDTNIDRVDISGSTGRNVPSTKLISSTFHDDSADYSPDGKRIVYVSDQTGSTELWLCDSDGTKPSRLTNFGGPFSGTPRWSPNGQWIAFDSSLGGNKEIFVISTDGGKPRRLTDDPALDALPSWSRDGRWAYFGSNRTGEFQLWKVPAEGGQAVQVTRRGGVEGFESADGKFVY